MDKTWMFVDRTTSKYDDGVDSFIRFAIVNSDDSNVIRCPCTKCRNAKLLHPNVVKDHLFVNGVLESYTTWFWHGENISSVPIEEKIESDFEVGDGLNTVEMVDAVYRDYETKPDGFVKLLSDAEKPLYSGCTTFNVLSTLVRLYNLKTKHGWTENSFSELLSLIGDILPKENSLPTSIYEAKKTLSTPGMQYTKIHACPNDCILYRKEYENSVVCPKCGLSRWKVMKNHKVKEGVPANVLWYFPPIPRFRRMFGTKEIAKDLTWHDNKRQIDSYMRHPADSPAWKVVDHKWPDFGSEPRNLRLALSADGVNPFSNYSTQYSCWPVILATYNLPPWLVMKRKFMMLTLLISGPKQPGNDIDVYLAPLIDDLKELWEVGVDVYDAYKKEVFNLKAILLWTINDFPAYGNLSGCTVKGYKACPICGDNTVSQRLECSKKISYCGHRKYLPRGHKFRKQKKAFDGNEEHGLPPNPLSGEEVFEKVSGIHNEWGKSKKRKATRNNSDSTLSWKKKSIFFNLEYWKHLYVRHCLDVMHIEKNVCESLIGTILGIPGKSKDGLSAREDLEVMGIRDELQPQKEGEKTYLPAACYNMSRAEKKKFYTTLFELKVPEGYSSNFKNRVSMDELKLNGLKSHDCHTLIQQLLPIAIRGMLPKKVRYAITKLCLFFNALCNKVLDVNTLDGIQEELVTTLCLLEMYFLPSFFDVMVHLTVHLIHEVKLCGPVWFRWMYPFERYMKVLKSYVRKGNNVEGCIAECYIAEEALEYCAEYLKDVSAVGVPRNMNNLSSDDHGIGAGNVKLVDLKLLNQAHQYVLENTNEVEEYKDNISSNMRWISHGPQHQVIKYQGYMINGVRFHTKRHDDEHCYQNSGVSVVANTMLISSAKDKNPIIVDMWYYGVIEEIWLLDYNALKIPVFKCDWVKNDGGVKVDDLGFTLVDLQRKGHKNDPFIFASQANQVFYIEDPENPKWSCVIENSHEKFGNSNNDDSSDKAMNLHFPAKSIPLVETIVNTLHDDESSYVRLDGEPMYID
ncbi:hypothetical protein UlMin_042418 [Ulmus minor]